MSMKRQTVLLYIHAIVCSGAGGNIMGLKESYSVYNLTAGIFALMYHKQLPCLQNTE